MRAYCSHMQQHQHFQYFHLLFSVQALLVVFSRHITLAADRHSLTLTSTHVLSHLSDFQLMSSQFIADIHGIDPAMRYLAFWITSHSSASSSVYCSLFLLPPRTQGSWAVLLVLHVHGAEKAGGIYLHRKKGRTWGSGRQCWRMLLIKKKAKRDLFTRVAFSEGQGRWNRDDFSSKWHSALGRVWVIAGLKRWVQQFFPLCKWQGFFRTFPLLLMGKISWF